MTETTKTQKDKRFYAPALFVLPLGIIAALFIPIVGFFMNPTTFKEAVARNIISVAPSFLGIILCIFVLVKIRRNPKVLKGFFLTLAGLALFTTFTGWWFYCQITSDHSGLGVPSKCTTNLSSLHKALLAYDLKFKGYPSAEKWCDLLLEHTDVALESFIRPDFVLYWPVVGGDMFLLPPIKKQNCGYALNPNAKPDSPYEMVVIFESIRGWNLHGGPELIDKKIHNGEGINILYNNSSVRFETTNDFNDFKWK